MKNTRCDIIGILASVVAAVAILTMCAGISSAQDRAADANAPQVSGTAAKAAEAMPQEPMSFARDRYAEALRLNAMGPSAERDDGIRAFAGALIDYDDYARRSMGERWKTIGADRQAEFKSLFRELMELTYIKRLSKRTFRDDYPIEWDRVERTKDAATVSCFTRQKDVETELEIVMHAEGGAWRVYDTLVDGASLADTYRKKYDKKIAERGIDGILSDMRREIEKLRAE